MQLFIVGCHYQEKVLEAERAALEAAAERNAAMASLQGQQSAKEAVASNGHNDAMTASERTKEIEDLKVLLSCRLYDLCRSSPLAGWLSCLLCSMLD